MVKELSMKLSVSEQFLLKETKQKMQYEQQLASLREEMREKDDACLGVTKQVDLLQSGLS